MAHGLGVQIVHRLNYDVVLNTVASSKRPWHIHDAALAWRDRGI